MLSVKTDELYNSNDIVNSNDIRKHIVNIDSRFRKSYLEPPTDFLYQFAHPYKNVIKARVASVEIPYGFYNFSDYNIWISLISLFIFTIILVILNMILLNKGVGFKE